MARKPKPAPKPPGPDTPPPTPAAPLPYGSFDEALIGGDPVTADAYFRHENRTADWLLVMIDMRSRTVANYDSSKPESPFNNNAKTAAYAAMLIPLYQAYLARIGG